MSFPTFENVKEETWSITLSPLAEYQVFDRELTIRDATNCRDTKLRAILTIMRNQNAVFDISLVSKEDLCSCKIRVQDLQFLDQHQRQIAVRSHQHDRNGSIRIIRYGDLRPRPSNPPLIFAEGDIATKTLVVDTQVSAVVLSQSAQLHGSFTVKFTILSTFEWRNNTGTEDFNRTGKKHDVSQGQRVLDDLQSMLTDEGTADFRIRATLGKEKTFMCHKFILIARSPIFRAMLGSQMIERDQNITTVDDIGPATMEHFLSFLYCGKFQDETWVQYLPNLTYVADKYCVADLKEYCDKNLIKSVTGKNALALANLAQRHELPTAVGQIRKFVEKNAGSLNFDIASAAEGLEIGQ